MRREVSMGQKLTTKDIRHIYLSEVKNNAIKRIGKTIFVLIFGLLSIILADAAANPDIDQKKPDFRK